MLKLNIKSKSYMCLDIEVGSFIHQQLASRWFSFCKLNASKGSRGWAVGLKMLPSFHISLGKPTWFNTMAADSTVAHDLLEAHARECTENISHMDVVPIIGDITLAPLVVSEKDDKMSAWIPLHPHWIENACQPPHGGLSLDLNLDQFDSYDHMGSEDEDFSIKLLHVSIANLTGSRYDSIARPEDCIIDESYL